MIRRPPRSTLFPYTTLFRSLLGPADPEDFDVVAAARRTYLGAGGETLGVTLIKTRTASAAYAVLRHRAGLPDLDRKSTRLNSSHANISYAVFCLKKKKLNNN